MPGEKFLFVDFFKKQFYGVILPAPRYVIYTFKNEAKK